MKGIIPHDFSIVVVDTVAQWWFGPDFSLLQSFKLVNCGFDWWQWSLIVRLWMIVSGGT